MQKASPSQMQFLLGLVKPYPKVVAVVVLASILGSAFDGISIAMLLPLLSHLQGGQTSGELPALFARVLDVLDSYSSGQQVACLIGIVMGAILLKNLLISASFKTGHWLTARICADLRLRASSLLLQVALGFHRQSKQGDLLEKVINNTSRIDLLVKTCLELVANSATLLTLLALMLLLSWQLSLVVFGVGAIFAGMMNGYMKTLARSGKELAHSDRELLVSMHESLSGIELIKSNSLEQHQMRLLQTRIEDARRRGHVHNFRGFIIHPLTDLVGNLGIGVLVAAFFMGQGDTRVSLAQLLPFLYVMLRLVPLAKIVSGQRAEIIGLWCYLGLIQDFLRPDDKPFIPSGTQIFENLRHEIRFENLDFTYPNTTQPVLQNATFSIPARQITAIIGESGAGKSTLLQLLLKLYQPQRGRILLDGEPLDDFQLESFHRKVGIVSQEVFLFNATIRDNIALGLDNIPDEKVMEAARKAGAHGFIEAMPAGYATLIGDRGVKLSGGQRQRLAIARALLKEPEILIFDEATNALDHENEAWIHQEIAKFGTGKTVVIVTHRLSTLNIADQVLRVEKGLVIPVAQTMIIP